MAKEVQYCNKRYKGSLTDAQCNLLEQYIQLDKNNGNVPDLQNVIYDIPDDEVEEIIKGKTTESLDNPPLGTLRDYQTLAVAFGYNAGNFILGDAVGLGKTVETAGLINLLKIEKYKNEQKFYNYLLLTEKNLTQQVQREMVKFTGEYVYRLKDSTEPTVEKFIEDFPVADDLEISTVGTHHLLKTPIFIAWLEQKRQKGKFPYDMLIIDESSVLGGSSTNEIVKAYKSISKYFKRIIMLNATPFESNLMTFYNQLNLLDSKALPTKQNFEKEYCIMRWNGMYNQLTGKYKNTEQFKELIKYFYFARTRQDRGAVMKDCKGRIIYSELSAVQKEWLKKTQMNRLVYDCPTTIEDTIEFNEENVPKLKSLRELLETDCKDADQILIFVHFKEAQKFLSEYLTSKGYSNKILNGATVNKERDEIIDGFKNKEYQVLITNVQKGLNFGSCEYCIFYSYDPNPSKMVQFEGRTTRSFNIEGKSVYILCSRGQEERTLNNVVKQRAIGMNNTTNLSLSVIMSILLENMS